VERRYVSHDSSHDMEHVRAVVRLTNHFCSEAETELSLSDMAVADAAAWLHDLLDRKYVSDVSSVSLDLQQSIVAAGLLSETEAHRAVLIAKNISFSSRLARDGRAPHDLTGTDELLYYYVSDADMLEAMGCIGVIRTCIYQAIHKKDSSIDSALQYTVTTLSRCVDYMRHPLAKIAASKRRDAMLTVVSLVKLERSITSLARVGQEA